MVPNTWTVLPNMSVLWDEEYVKAIVEFNFKSLQNLNAKKLPNTSTYRDVNIFL